MINRKALVFYLVLSFLSAWVFFLLPLSIGDPGSETRQISSPETETEAIEA